MLNKKEKKIVQERERNEEKTFLHVLQFGEAR